MSEERKDMGEEKKKTMDKKILLLPVALIAAFVILSGVYTVGMNQYAAVSQFGRIVAVHDTPGLKMKVPFIQSVRMISKRTKLYDVPLSDVITRDKKSMIADNYVLWKVSDPTKYIRTLDAMDPRAEERIEAAVYNALKNVISSLNQDEVIEARGDKLTQMLTEEANSDIGDYGIEILTAEIKALDLPDDNKDAVYKRMISERENIAASYKAEGEAEAKKIKNDTNKQVQVTKAEARKQAEIIEAEGEAKYMEILANAYDTEEKKDFYLFLRSLDAYKASLSGSGNTIIIDKDSEIAELFYDIP